MSHGYFITGTDTNIGKSIVAASLIHAMAQRGLKVAGMKPVSTGCFETENGLRNEDAELMMKYSNVELSYETVNPYAYLPPVSPHLAAKKVGQRIELDKITRIFSGISQVSDCVIVEGVGGWLVPLNDTETVEDLAVAMQLPLIVVIGTRLGCINHAMLTIDRIQKTGLEVAGWVANIMDRNIDYLPDVIDSLRLRISAPLVGIIPPYRMINPERAADHLSIQRILEDSSLLAV
ncbi:MAG: dethiobiotin synthase [Gammaproteobacteria bacterium]|nr:dethiobiotin synthase [Gammaproteobacteria bacterium]